MAVAGQVPLAAGVAEATYPGRDGRIVFELNRFNSGNNTSRLVAIDAQAGRRLPLDLCVAESRRGRGCPSSDPSFSPDGRRLFYVRGDISGRGKGSDAPALVKARPDGSVLRTLKRPWYGGGPVSPDGRRLAIAGGRGMQALSTTDGTLRRLTRAPGRILDIDWSSRGRLIYVRRYRDQELLDGAGLDLWAVSPRGRRLRRLTTDGRSVSPSWSPDGSRVVFQRFWSGGGRASTIWTMNADGSNERRIGRGSSPVWSPDGQSIAFVTGISFERRTVLYVARTDGTRRRRVFSIRDDGFDEYSILSPAWQALPPK